MRLIIDQNPPESVAFLAVPKGSLPRHQLEEVRSGDHSDPRWQRFNRPADGPHWSPRITEGPRVDIDENGNIRSEATHQFKDSAIGCIPVEWDVLNLESIVDEPITYGIVQAGLYIEGGIPYIRTGDMSGDSIPLDRLLRTSKRIADAYKRSTVYQMDIVFALRATVGKVLPIPQELNGANLTQGTAKISPSSNFDENFILWALRTSMVSQQILAVQKGTTFFEITLSDLRQLLLAVPKTKAEQTYISHCLITCEQKIQDEKRWLLKQKNTKTGLMQDLLTGKVRVTNLLKEKEPTIP